MTEAATSTDKGCRVRWQRSDMCCGERRLQVGFGGWFLILILGLNYVGKERRVEDFF